MNIAFRTRILIAASAVVVGLAASLSHAQTTTVNGVPCTAANAVTVTFTGGALNIVTGGCGVTPPPVSTSPPTISSVSPTSGALGDTVTISGANLGGATSVLIGGAPANPGNNSGTQIITTVPSSASVGPGNIVVTTSVTPAATFAFTVNAPPPAAAPTISSVSPASGSVNTLVTINGTGLTGATVTIGGVAATIAASSSTSITTTVPATAPVAAGSVVVTTAVAPAASFAFTVTATAPGADVSVDGITLPNPSKRAFINPPFHGGLNGAGSEVNAYAMSPTRCLTTPALTRSWQHNIDLMDYKSKNAFDFFVMQAGESLSYKFTTPATDNGGGFVYNDAANAVVRPTFISVSTSPCDFDASKIGTNACYQTGINGNSVGWHNTGAEYPGYCRVTKGTVYYMNIRFQDARPGLPPSDSCVSGNCGGLIQVL